VQCFVLARSRTSTANFIPASASVRYRTVTGYFLEALQGGKKRRFF
jgi:hypothetical protein